MNICVISEGYPSEGRNEYPFVQHLCEEWANQGNNVTVIVPHSKTKRIIRHLKRVPFYSEKKINNGTIKLICPEYLTFGSKGRKIGYYFFEKSILGVSDIIDKPDFVYGHFWHVARGGYELAQMMSCPLVVASGEAEIEQRIWTKKDLLFTRYVNSVVCVSSKNRDESISLNLTQYDKCKVFPNSIEPKLFYKKNKDNCRERLGFNFDDFIISFVGGFIPRKGPERVAQALTKLEQLNIKSIFIGTNRDGSYTPPECRGILFKGSLSHEDIPDYLNASDVFVLPTIHEGCCNAIVEAMACGLPIVSSNRPFNTDILDSTNSILIDPLSIDEIANAIKEIYESKDLRVKMGEASLLKARDLTISNRAKNILDFIIEKNNL